MDPGGIDLGDDRDVLGPSKGGEIAGAGRADREDPLHERRVAVASELEDRRDRRDRVRNLQPRRLDA